MVFSESEERLSRWDGGRNCGTSIASPVFGSGCGVRLTPPPSPGEKPDGTDAEQDEGGGLGDRHALQRETRQRKINVQTDLVRVIRWAALRRRCVDVLSSCEDLATLTHEFVELRLRGVGFGFSSSRMAWPS